MNKDINEFKLDHNSLLQVKTNIVDHDINEHFRRLVGHLNDQGKDLTVIFTGKEIDIKEIPESKMNEMGWYKR